MNQTPLKLMDEEIEARIDRLEQLMRILNEVAQHFEAVTQEHAQSSGAYRSAKEALLRARQQVYVAADPELTLELLYEVQRRRREAGHANH